MKKLIKFPSIEQFRNIVGVVNREYSFVGLDANGESIYDNFKGKPTLKFKGTIKLHGCFEKNTMITLANGEEAPIEELKTGDTVISYDFETQELIEKEITNIQSAIMNKKWLKLIFDNNLFIECTEDHKFYTKNRGWIEAKNLTKDDEFIEYNKLLH